MKKLLLVLALVFATATSAMAQRAGEATVWADDNDINHSGFYLNPYLGAMAGDVSTSFGFGAEIGYRYHFGYGINWDILTLGWNSCSDSFEELSSIRLMTGVRYNTPQILAGKSMYINFNLGYQFNTYDGDLNGFTYGVGLGVNLSRLVSLGIAWEGNTKHEDYWDSNLNWGIVGLKLGINF